VQTWYEYQEVIDWARNDLAKKASKLQEVAEGKACLADAKNYLAAVDLDGGFLEVTFFPQVCWPPDAVLADANIVYRFRSACDGRGFVLVERVYLGLPPEPA
jgi:hypothetical protein